MAARCASSSASHPIITTSPTSFSFSFSRQFNISRENKQVPDKAIQGPQVACLVREGVGTVEQVLWEGECVCACPDFSAVGTADGCRLVYTLARPVGGTTCLIPVTAI